MSWNILYFNNQIVKAHHTAENMMLEADMTEDQYDIAIAAICDAGPKSLLRRYEQAIVRAIINENSLPRLRNFKMRLRSEIIVRAGDECLTKVIRLEYLVGYIHREAQTPSLVREKHTLHASILDRMTNAAQAEPLPLTS